MGLMNATYSAHDYRNEKYATENELTAADLAEIDILQQLAAFELSLRKRLK